MEDPRFDTRDARVHHDAELTVEIERWSGELATDDVVASLARAGVPVAPVRSPQEAVRDERVTAREETVPVRHPTLGELPDLRTTGVPLRMSESVVGFDRLAPLLGEHTAEILGQLDGYDEGRQRELRAEGAI
jgi:crotonobetainyl-CoA:carnitine CoA-transferase CaiB-like acyl-CoA transferase